MSAPAITLHPFRGRVHALLDHRDDVDTATLDTALGALLDGAGLAEFLHDLLHDPDRLVHIAGASYWHANGFAKLVLHRSDGFCLRLHVWPVGRPQVGEVEPHSHRWNFASTVLAGGLTVLLSEEADDGSGMRYVRCSYDGDQIRPGVDTTLREGPGFTVLRGERYVTDTSVIHAVHPHPGATIATLLLQGPHRRASTEVYRVPGQPGLPPASPISADEVRELLVEVVEAMESR